MFPLLTILTNVLTAGEAGDWFLNKTRYSMEKLSESERVDLKKLVSRRKYLKPYELAKLEKLRTKMIVKPRGKLY